MPHPYQPNCPTIRRPCIHQGQNRHAQRQLDGGTFPPIRWKGAIERVASVPRLTLDKMIGNPGRLQTRRRAHRTRSSPDGRRGDLR